MEIESVNSKANAGLTTGIIGTAGVGLALLSNGLFGGGLGRNSEMGSAVASGLCSAIPSALENAISRNEFEHRISDVQTIAEKDSQIAELKMNSAMDSKVLDLYKYVENNLHSINEKFANQGVWNATATGNMSMMSAQISALQNACSSITKTVVPITAVCPQPMPLYNSWKEPTTETTGN